MRFIAFLAAFFVAHTAWSASSINTQVPAQGVPYSPAPIRQNFAAAATDIGNLQDLNAGSSAPSQPTAGTPWLNTSTTTYVLNIWDGQVWLPIASIDSVNHIWMPPVGGGVIPNLLSATTTDLGIVPQAAVQVTGNNIIQSFGSSAPTGQVKFIIFAGAPVITANSTILITPSNTNISVKSGDTAVAIALGAGNWKILSYQSTGTGRIVLTGPGNLYVSPQGSDANNTCASQAAPCATLQHATDIALRSYDFAGYQMFINLAATGGTPYSAGVNVSGPIVGSSFARTPAQSTEPEAQASLVYLGSPSNADSVVINSTANAPVFYTENGAVIQVNGVNIIVPNNTGMLANDASKIQLLNIDFGTTNADMVANNFSLIEALGSYTISGPKTAGHALSGFSSTIRWSNLGGTVTFSGSPSITYFISATDTSSAALPTNWTFTGTPTGKKFLVGFNSTIWQGGAQSLANLPSTLTAGSIVAGGIVDQPIPPISVTAATGLGAGGTAALAPGTINDSLSGRIQLNSGSSGTASTGQFTINFATNEFKICLGDARGPFGAGSVITPTNVTAPNITFVWTSAGGNLAPSTAYFVDYLCRGNVP